MLIEKRSVQLQTWIWPFVLVLSCVLVEWMVLAGVAGVLRVAAVTWFVLACPGIAVVRAVGVEDVAKLWCWGTAFSMALGIGLSLAMLYLGLWHPVWELSLLVLITLSATAVALQRERRNIADGCL